MRNLKHKIIITAKNSYSLVKNPKIAERMVREDVPYFSQWESQDLVEDIVSGKMSASDDPRWKKSGAKTTDEYALWSWAVCGMACLKMILAHTQNKNVPLLELAQKCTEYGGYQLPIEDSRGLFYKPFVKFVQKEYDLKAKASSALSLNDIKYTLSKNSYVIASVTPEIRHPDKKPAKKGGHLILVHGYDDTKKVIYFHNPSGISKTQQNVSLGYDYFQSFFSHKGIIVFNND